jgi:hypothetical protein
VLPAELSKISYASLNSKEKEDYNFQKMSGILADYGFTTIRLNNDWNGADFIALLGNGKTYRVQQKGRIYFSPNYENKDVWIAFIDRKSKFELLYLFPHDVILEKIPEIKNTKSWKDYKYYSFSQITEKLRILLTDYCFKS